MSEPDWRVDDEPSMTSSWPRAGGLVVGGFLALAALGWAVGTACRSGPVSLDQSVLNLLARHRSAALTDVARTATTIGAPIGLAITAAVVVLLLVARRRRSEDVVVAAVAVLGVELLSTTVKSLVGRARPPLAEAVAEVSAHGFSFPSGHATQSAAIYGALAVLVARGVAARGTRVVLAIAAVAATLVVGSSRLYLGVHWFSDVTVGWLIGAGWLAVVVAAARIWSGGAVPRPPCEADAFRGGP